MHVSPCATTWCSYRPGRVGELQQYNKYKFFYLEQVDTPCNSTFHILVEHDTRGSTMHDHFQQDPAVCEPN